MVLLGPGGRVSQAVASSFVDIHALAQAAGIETGPPEDPWAGLPTAKCPRLRPPLLPVKACKTEAERIWEAAAKSSDNCKPRPPAVCEDARRAEADLKFAKDAVKNSVLLTHVHKGAVSDLLVALLAVAPERQKAAPCFMSAQSGRRRTAWRADAFL
eukprot:TRINITY_DN65161_c0_g1_i1.p1 TRINITY_DN65161_c0_g1~~TRINITY_DN65161_c0_g1_i1.p1  ORF type:complete len:157 (-),score=18.71 TRINITY_DN65161_c0_g1_i1:22-492(-)